MDVTSQDLTIMAVLLIMTVVDKIEESGFEDPIAKMAVQQQVEIKINQERQRRREEDT